MHKLSISILLALAATAFPAGAEERLPACAASPLRVGECITVHGRMTSCTAVPSVRIWVIGTKRILGVVDAGADPAGEQLLPDRLDRELSTLPPCSRAAFGDFTVCPLTPDQPGVMRKVCLDSATNLIFQDW